MKTALVVIAIAWFMQFACGQEATGTPLETISAVADRQHPALRAARADVEVARGNAIQAGLYPNPTLEFGSDQFGGGANQFPVLLSQRIVTAGKLTLDQQAAFQQVTQAEQRYIQTRFQIVTAVRRAFYSALAGQERIDVLQQLVELISTSKELAERRLKGGQGTRSDVVLLEIELRQIEAQLRSTEAGQRGRLRQLLAAAGAPADSNLAGVDGDFYIDVGLGNYDNLLTTLGRVNAQALEADIEVVRRRLLLQRAEVEPIPDVTVLFGYQGNTGIDNPDNQGRLTFSMPLPVWNRNQGNRFAAGNAIQRAGANAQAVRVQLSESLADAWRRYLAASEQVKVIVEELVPATTEAINLTRKGYEAGEVNLLAFLRAQQALAQAYLSYVEIQEQRWLAAADVAGLLQWEVFPPMPATPTPAATADKTPVVPNVPPAP